ncbi:unnamed protein product, partial [Symbiodinium microadriaticum]
MKFVASQYVSTEDPLDCLISLRAVTLLPGDVLYIPPCQVMVEKTLRGSAVGIRSTPTFFHRRCYNLCKLYLTVHSGCLVLFWLRLLLVVLVKSHTPAFVLVIPLFQWCLRDFHAKVMAEEFRKLTFPGGPTLAEAIGVSQPKLKESLPSKAVAKPDGTMVACPKKLQTDEPMEDTLNSYVDMCEEERHALVELMDEAELTLHINMAKVHPECKNYEKYVVVDLLGKPWDEDGGNNRRIGGEGRRVQEDVFGWYEFLQKKNIRFPPGFTSSLDASSLQSSKADYLNSFVHMSEEKRLELLQAMDESELVSVHINAAKAHPECKSYETYVKEVYGAEDDYMFGTPDGDMLQDALGWYQFLQEKKLAFPTDFENAAVPSTSTIRQAGEVPPEHKSAEVSSRITVILTASHVVQVEAEPAAAVHADVVDPIVEVPQVSNLTQLATTKVPATLQAVVEEPGVPVPVPAEPDKVVPHELLSAEQAQAKCPEPIEETLPPTVKLHGEAEEQETLPPTVKLHGEAEEQ